MQKQDNDALLASLQKRLGEIQARLKQLDADYAVSLANWKRNEIDTERAKLKDEQQGLVSRMAEMMGGIFPTSRNGVVGFGVDMNGLTIP